MIYLRQSKDHEGTGLAVERQLEDCRSLVERRGWEVTRVITDNDVSASSTKVRPGYRELLAQIDAKGCDVVVAWAPDRLLRRPIEMEDLIDRTERTGVKIVTCQNDMDLESPAGRLAARMFAVVARSEVENREQEPAAEAPGPAGRGEGAAPSAPLLRLRAGRHGSERGGGRRGPGGVRAGPAW
ncbi:MAG TPA: recombinase family protein [Geodermatophilus sp.]|nr:recombinase family protein [Geodermatophilus sp.]